MLAHPYEDKSENGVSVRQVRIELHGLARVLVRQVEGSRIEKIAVHAIGPDERVRAGEDGVGSGVVCINGKRLLQQTPRFVDILRSQ